MSDVLRFLTVLFWEYVQNVPVVLGFALAVWYWARDERGRAGVAMGAGAVLGALIIRYTEALKIGRPYMEAWSVTLVNVVGFGMMLLLFTLYLGREAGWSNRRIDLALGALAGGGFALAQGLAAPNAPLIGVVLHSVSLAVAAATVLVMLRQVKEQTLRRAVGSALLATAVMTVIISVIDYSYLLVI
jgi:hypothetical protein